MRRAIALLLVGVCGVAASDACGGGKGGPGLTLGDGGDASGSSSGGGSSGSSSGNLVGDGATPPTGDPSTCAGAASLHSYIGCDYWPTVTANNVWSIFDFAVVVANGGTAPADITLTGPAGTSQTASVAAGGLSTLYLPWVAALKGADSDACGSTVPLPASVLAPGGAYHLVSTLPVTVYQFSALEYFGQGGPASKDWSACPGDGVCASTGAPKGCYSFTNDASLLLPSTAMTGNYRVIGHYGWSGATMGSTTTITSTAAHTTVTVKVSSTGAVLAGAGIAATTAGGTLTLAMGEGDVAELVGGSSDTSNNSGSVITANNPIQVITGMPCLQVPDTAPACDHVEETVLPAETLGDDYVIAQPTGPGARVVPHVVHLVGDFDGTTLTYLPAPPSGCPTSLSAGQVVNCGQVTGDVEVKGTQPFGVAMFTMGASVVDPGTKPPNQEGDPDETIGVAVKQFRTSYVLLAPEDYEESYLVVVEPTGTTVTLDGAAATGTATPIAGTGFAVLRLTLDNGGTGAHTLTASSPVGVQVMGYGSYTSYTYPGGLDLQHIAPPPPTK